MTQDEFESMVATLEQENRQLRARNERLQAENDALNLELGNPIDTEEWAKHQTVCPPCNHNCNQGRTCPNR